MQLPVRTLRTAAAASLLLASQLVLAQAPAAGDDPLPALQSAYLRAVAPGAEADRHRDLFATVLQRVQRSYAGDVDSAALAEAARKVLDPLPAGAGEPAEVFRRAINASLRTLDPWSRYLDPRAHQNERGDASGAFGGLGLQVEPAEDGGVRVIAPMPGSPAERAGLQAGDLIVRVDDQPLTGVPLTDAVARMRGAPGTPVALTIRRDTASPEFTVSVTRDTIRRKVLTSTVEEGVLVLRLAAFTGSTSTLLEQAIVEAAVNHTLRGIVLDLRGNGGGLLREAVKTADAFLRQGEIVSLRGRGGASQRSWQADAEERLPDLPMVVLIDRRSASASELVAAALQENGRALVMGERSFGKGTVQSTLFLGEEAGALKLTTSYYHGPAGNTVHKTGVGPDVELVRNDVTASAPVATVGPGPVARATAKLEPARCTAVYKAADPALACAVGYARSGQIDAFLASLPAAARPPH